jgi:hypothetical protein
MWVREALGRRSQDSGDRIQYSGFTEPRTLNTEHRTLNPGPCSFPVLFDRAGTFTAIATLDGISFASLVISVTQVDFQGPIACQIGFRREKEVLVYGPASAVFFTPQPFIT